MRDNIQPRQQWSTPAIEPLTGPDGLTEEAHASTRNGFNTSQVDR